MGTVTSSSPITELYDPKTFFTHAVLLRQGCPHCAIFPTAASRRSLDRVSVPVWPFALSDRLPIVALVSRCLTNQLIGRGPIFRHRSFDYFFMRKNNVMRLYSRFPEAIPLRKAGCPRVTHPFATVCFLNHPKDH